ncbi:MAG TPA: TylF/MycF/NovP-related O-methyltransferase [Hyphomonas sp.]|nr:TylF/MycF/NovP-related O-methyltransferase [Hyphomonas sp.]HRK68728.1 TylF/MycF/NovP-related O-methyltransferase [Hyphomonas sp.]
MKEAIKSVLGRIGLLEPLREVKRKMVASGLLPWTPLVPEEAFTECACNAIRTLQSHGHSFGDYVEFGVSRGTSMACTWAALKSCGVSARLIGFDSFEGLGSDAADTGWEAGQYASTEAATRRYLAAHGVPENQIVLVKGWFCDTATDETRRNLHIEKASIFLVDADTYDSSREALDFAAKVMGDEMVLMFDDWGWTEKWGQRGQKEAYAEFLAANPAFHAAPLPAYRDEARVFLLSRTAA